MTYTVGFIGGGSPGRLPTALTAIAEKRIQFYENLGLKVIDPIRELDEEALAQAMQLPRGYLKISHLAPPEAPSKMFIDLVQWLDPFVHRRALPSVEPCGN